MTDDGFPGRGCEAVRQKTIPAPKVTEMMPYRAPANVRQETLCEIFAEVLHLPKVGIDDDFFALGGQSVDGVLIAIRANAAFSCQLSLADLFDAPTVAELDRQLDASIKAGR